jgi:DNA-binding response OmpR family regulator
MEAHMLMDSRLDLMRANSARLDRYDDFDSLSASRDALEISMQLAILTRNAVLFEFLRESLSSGGISCVHFDDDIALVRSISRTEFGAVLIDADTGVDPLRPLLAQRRCYTDRHLPVILIGVAGDTRSSKTAFDAGVDDVVLAPINARELSMRVHLAMRRTRSAKASEGGRVLERGSYRLHQDSCVAFVCSKPVRLTPREFAIAWLLFSNEGEYVSRRQIAGAVWSTPEDVVARSLEQHIYKLRKKLELYGAHGKRVQTRYAHGYRIESVELRMDSSSDGLADSFRDCVES